MHYNTCNVKITASIIHHILYLVIRTLRKVMSYSGPIVCILCIVVYTRARAELCYTYKLHTSERWINSLHYTLGLRYASVHIWRETKTKNTLSFEFCN